MCGISVVFVKSGSVASKRSTHHLSSRGPDESKGMDIKIGSGFASILFHRLSVVNFGENASTGMQPFVDRASKVISVINGECYDFRRESKEHDIDPTTLSSDCEFLHRLYIKKRDLAFIVRHVVGEFAAIFVDGHHILWTVDCFQRRPLYYRYRSGELVVQSVLFEGATHVSPYNVYIFDTTTCELKVFPFAATPITYHPAPTTESYTTDMNVALIRAVKRSLTATSPGAFLLSGGIDSGLVVSIASYILSKNPSDPLFMGGSRTIDAFTFVAEGELDPPSNDLIQSRKIVQHLRERDRTDIQHHIVVTPISEILGSVDEVIRTVGYDETTNRAGWAMWAAVRGILRFNACQELAKKKKWVACGGFADEINGGYLEVFNTKSVEELVNLLKKRLEEIHRYDCLREDRVIGTLGSLEARSPFGDRDFVRVAREYSMFAAELIHKHKIEKMGLRLVARHWLPESVAMGCKETFSNSSKHLIARVQAYIKDRMQTTHNQKMMMEFFEYRRTHDDIGAAKWAETLEQLYYVIVFAQEYGWATLNVTPEYWRSYKSANTDSSAAASMATVYATRQAQTRY